MILYYFKNIRHQLIHMASVNC